MNYVQKMNEGQAGRNHSRNCSCGCHSIHAHTPNTTNGPAKSLGTSYAVSDEPSCDMDFAFVYNFSRNKQGEFCVVRRDHLEIIKEG